MKVKNITRDHRQQQHNVWILISYLVLNAEIHNCYYMLDEMRVCVCGWWTMEWVMRRERLKELFVLAQSTEIVIKFTILWRLMIRWQKLLFFFLSQDSILPFHFSLSISLDLLPVQIEWNNKTFVSRFLIVIFKFIRRERELKLTTTFFLFSLGIFHPFFLVQFLHSFRIQSLKLIEELKKELSLSKKKKAPKERERVKAKVRRNRGEMKFTAHSLSSILGRELEKRVNNRKRMNKKG